MSGRKRLILLIGILTVVAGNIAGSTFFTLYNAALEQQRATAQLNRRRNNNHKKGATS